MKSTSSLLVALAMTLSITPQENCTASESPPFNVQILGNAKTYIDLDKHATNKHAMYDLLADLSFHYNVVERGNDNLRLKFVNTQGYIESVLANAQANGEISDLVGVFHAPFPETSLCITPKSNIDTALDPSISKNHDKRLTVRARAQVVRDSLKKGARLYVVYPQGGLEACPAEQQATYREELHNFSDTLFDYPLFIDSIDPEMTGTTYLFRNQDNELCAFSVKARQANDVLPVAEWGMWLGRVSESPIGQRVNEVFDYLSEKSGLDLR